MATPAIGDLNGDGHEELVVGVSWFFDREYYEDPVRPLLHSHACAPCGSLKQHVCAAAGGATSNSARACSPAGQLRRMATASDLSIALVRCIGVALWVQLPHP